MKKIKNQLFHTPVLINETIKYLSIKANKIRACGPNCIITKSNYTNGQKTEINFKVKYPYCPSGCRDV